MDWQGPPTWPRRLLGLVRLIHPYPVAAVISTSLLLLLIAYRGNPGLSTLARALGVILLSQITIGALNDYVDRFRDQMMQPDKPIPSGQVEAPVALALAVVSAVFFVPLALTFGLGPFLLIALGTVGGVAYDLRLKTTPASFVGYIVGFLSLVLWIWTIAGQLTPRFALALPAGALLVVAAHLAQSLPDVETDRRLGQQGLAALLGASRSFRWIMQCYAVAAIYSLGLSLSAGSRLSLVAIAASTLPTAIAWSLRHTVQRHQAARTLTFRLMAPAIALLAIALVLSLSHPNAW